jgi:exonuclease III
MKLFTQNLYHFGFRRKQRINEVKQYIDYKKFDLVFLQEIVLNSTLKNFDNILNKDFEHYVKGRLGPKGGLVIISKKKFNKLEFHKFREQGRLLSKQIVDRIIEKGFLVGYSGNEVYINTHLVATYRKEGGKSVENLNRQFNELLKFIKEKIKQKKKIILAGDFNFTPHSNNYKQITKLLQDNTIRKKKEIRAEHRKKYHYGEKDFIFSSFKKSKNYSEPAYPIFVSDHPGISVEISL